MVVNPIWRVECGLKIDKKVVCVGLLLLGLLQDLAQCEDLVGGGFTRLEATLI